MSKFFTIMLCLFASIGLIFAGTTGKISGKVLDKQTGEPLAGANVVIQGSTMGAAVDLEGDYYIIVKHRNHLAVMNAAAVTLSSSSVTSIDFTGSLSAYYGSNAAKELETDVYGMFAGDANSNGEVQNDDKNAYWKILVGSAGYLSADFNLNGEVQNDDKNNFWKQNVGSGTRVP